MKLMLVHLSDIHFKDREDKNPVLKRATAIAAAVAGLPDQVDGYVVLMAGDTAFSGKETEYQFALEFYKTTLEPLLKQAGSKPVIFVIIPGNHDCDFTVADSTRQILLDKLEAKSIVDEGPIKVCLDVQKGYKAFIDSLPGSFPSLKVLCLDGCYKTLTEEISGEHVSFNLLNSAWCSTQREKQGQLLFPTNLFEAATEQNDNSASIVISAIHHPFNWYASENGRALQAALDGRSDIILTGHEHVSTVYTNTLETGERIEYLEGGVLQDNDDDENSTFNVVILDSRRRTQDNYLLTWQSRHYTVSRKSEGRPFHRNKQRLAVTFPFTDEFQQDLDDAGAAFKHPKKDKLILSDIFIYPDLKEVTYEEVVEEAAFIKGTEVVESVIKYEHVLIIGADASGKSALAKSLASDLRKKGYLPVVIDGQEFQASDPKKITKLLEKVISYQYGSHQAEPYGQLEVARKAIVIDDYHLLRLNEAGKSTLLGYLFERFKIVVLLGGDEIRFEELSEASDMAALIQLKHLEIIEFGYQLRSRLIRTWHSIGGEHTLAREDIDDKVGRTESQINMLLGDFMPAYPLFILIALQQLEIQDNITESAGSVGHLYEYLIKRSLLASKTYQTSADTNDNYLTELAWHLFTHEIVRLSDDEAQQWHNAFCKTFRIKCDFERQWRALINAELLYEHGGLTSFKYPYVYYYFIAKYLADHITDVAIQERIRVLATYLHRPIAANVVLFLCHLSKNPIILESVIQTADKLFCTYKPNDLNEDVKFLNEVVSSNSVLTLDGSHPEENRQKLLENSDTERRAIPKKEGYEHTDLSVCKAESLCDMQQLNDQLQMNSALKTIQIIGQIVRNHVGSLNGEIKRQLVSKCYSLGLRLSKCLFSAVEESIDELVDALVEAVGRREGGLIRRPGAVKIVGNKDRLRDEISRSVWGTLELGMFAVVKYIAGSVGTEQLSETFADVLESERTMPLELIDIAIKLDHYKGFPENETLKLANSLKRDKNFFTFAILRNLVWNKFYLHHVKDYRLRQTISSKLDISVKGQQRITGRQPYNKIKDERRFERPPKRLK